MEYEESEMEYVTWLREIGHDEEYIEKCVFDSRVLQQMEDEIRKELANG